MSLRERKRNIPYGNDLSGCTGSSFHAADHNLSTETTHNGQENTRHSLFSFAYIHLNLLCMHIYVFIYVSITYACRYLEEYLDSKRPLSPLSPLSDSPDYTKPSSKSKNAEVHDIHTHRNRDKNRDSAVKVIIPTDTCSNHAFTFSLIYFPSFDLYTQPKMEVECVKVSRQPQPSSESWGPAGHRGTVPNNET